MVCLPLKFAAYPSQSARLFCQKTETASRSCCHRVHSDEEINPPITQVPGAINAYLSCLIAYSRRKSETQMEQATFDNARSVPGPSAVGRAIRYRFYCWQAIVSSHPYPPPKRRAEVSPRTLRLSLKTTRSIHYYCLKVQPFPEIVAHFSNTKSAPTFPAVSYW